MKKRDNFVSIYTPSFGKYEIEHFVGHKLMEALFITNDITDLMYSELLCDDSPFNITRISWDDLATRVLKCFDVVKGNTDNPNVVRLVFKWKPWKELE